MRLMREFEKEQRRAERDQTAFAKSCNNSDWVWTSEDYLMYQERINNYYSGRVEIENELSERRAETKKRREQREAREKQRRESASRSDGESSGEPLDRQVNKAFGNWLRRVNRNDTPGTSLSKIEFTWELDGEQYLGIYRPIERKLAAWIQVSPDTRGGRRFGSATYLPANNLEQINQARSRRGPND